MAQLGSDHHGGFTKRYLQQLVKRYDGCLSVISSQDATVLTLRTGWDAQRSYSRKAVARILHVSLAREGQIERKSVRAVGRAAKTGSCSRAQQANRSALFLSANEQALLGQSVPRAFASRANSPSTHASHKTPGHPRSAVSAASAAAVPASIPSLAHAGTSSFPWLFIILGLVAASALVSPLARRRWLHPGTAAGPIPARAPRRPGSGVGRRVAERAGAVGAAAAAGAAGLRAKRPGRRPSRNGAGAAPRTPRAPASRNPEPESATGAPAAAAGLGAVGAGAAASLGARLERKGDVEGALVAYRRADAAGDAAGATNLGVLLEQQGDRDGALAAYRRADDRGDANGSFNLGCLLADSGDFAGALAALKRADERGDPAGASNLGVLLEQQGDFDGALEAYRRADERGDPNGSFNLGLLLANRGDLAGAQEAYQRAGEGGDPEVVRRARSALAELSENGGPTPGDGAH